MSRVSAQSRVHYSEREERPGWRQVFTVAGGRLRGHDPLDQIDAQQRDAAVRALSQVCFSISDDGDRPVLSDATFRWATIVRKLLQRGSRPPISPRAEVTLRAALGEGFIPSTADVLAAIGWADRDWELASEYDLHPVYERPIWEWVREHAPSVLRWLVPQAPLEALTGDLPPHVSARWVDFLFCAPWLRAPTVIEIDGQGHVRRKGADVARDEALRASGLGISRFDGPDAVRADGRLYSAFLTHQREKAPSSADPRLLGLLHGPATPTRIGLAIVEAVLAGFLRPGKSWRLEIDDRLGLAADLAGVALDPLRAISDVWGSGVVPDRVVVNGRAWQLGGGRATETSTPRHKPPDLVIRLEPMTPYFARLPERGPDPVIVARAVGVPVDLAWSPALVRSRGSVPKDATVDEALHLLVSDVFGHDGFRDGQLAAVRQVLSGEDSVVLLPTGSGKSLIYQLAGLITPGATMIVDPLVSLIDDQAERLERDGIDRVAAMHSGRMDRPAERDRVLGAMARGEAIFVFATPERFQSQRFRNHLAQATADQLVGIVVVDEAHCVSEWGHDFRTSYLRLAHTLRTRCSDSAGVPPPLLALTGTASPAVLRDVLRELEIDEERDGALQRPASHDRPNLRYEKHTSTEATWIADLGDVLLARLPDFLADGRPVEGAAALELLTTCAGGDTASGIIFTPHVNWRYGAVAVAQAVRDAFKARGTPIDAVVYSGAPPDGREADWAQEKAESVDRFKDNEVPLLVGTKAFGMGIDKPNIRYTIHAGIPSSLEAFAQEAGRAGRNQQQALCTLIAILPAPEVADQLLSLDLAPDARKRLVKATNSTRGADVVRQAFFLTNSFPGVDEEVARAAQTLTLLGGTPRPRSRHVLPLPRAYPGADKKLRRRIEDERSALDRALYRLALAGVIADMTVDGAEVTIDIEDWTLESLDRALLTYLARIEPGRADLQAEEVVAGPADDAARIGHHITMLIESTYRIVAHARLQALRFMYDTAAGPDDPDAIRGRINAYLGGGPVATALLAAVTAPRVDVRRFVEVFSAIATREQDDLLATAALVIESYAGHPIPNLVSAIAVGRTDPPDRPRFRRWLSDSMAQFTRYGVDDDDAAVGAEWVARLLRTENGGRRADWLLDILETWDESGHSSAQLVQIEDAILEEARAHRSPPSAARYVRDRRLRRHAKTASSLADRLTGSKP